MPRVSLFSRRLGPVGLALALYDIYRRLPAKQRRQLLDLTRKHGPKVARAAYTRGQTARAARTTRKR
jgi:hypothetical protein